MLERFLFYVWEHYILGMIVSQWNGTGNIFKRRIAPLVCHFGYIM